MKALNEQITAYLYLRSKELGITEDSIDQFAYGLAIAKNIGVMRHNIAYNRQLIIASSLEDAIRASYLLLFDNLDAFLTEKTGEH